MNRIEMTVEDRCEARGRAGRRGDRIAVEAPRVHSYLLPADAEAVRIGATNPMILPAKPFIFPYTTMQRAPTPKPPIESAPLLRGEIRSIEHPHPGGYPHREPPRQSEHGDGGRGHRQHHG